METKLQQRLEELKREYASGQEVATELNKKQSALHDTLMGISGAMQVLEELLQEQESKESSSPVAEAVGSDSAPEGCARIAQAG